MGVDVTDHGGGALGHPQIALPQRHAFLLGQVGELLNRAMGEPGVGVMGAPSPERWCRPPPVRGPCRQARRFGARP